MSERTRDGSAGPSWLLLVVGAALTALAIGQCRDLAHDDAYITYRYARNLFNGLGFVYNPGARVLGTTTPLYTLLLTPFAFSTSFLPIASNTISCLAVAFQAWALRRILLQLGVGPSLGALGSLFLLSGGLGAYWNVGLETNLAAALMLWSVSDLLAARLGRGAVLAALACLARPDAVLLAGLMGVEELCGGRERARRLRVPVLVFAAIGTAWLIFSEAYFGSALPGTLGAKQHATAPGRYLAYVSVGLATAPLSMMLRRAPGNLDLYAATPANLAFAGAIFGLYAIGLVSLARRRKPGAAILLYPLLFLFAYARVGPPVEHTWHVYPAQCFLYLGALIGLSEIFWRLPERAASLAAPARFAWVAATVLGVVYLAGFRETYAGDDHFGLRRQTMEDLAATVRVRAPPSSAVSALEIGILGYLCPNPIVDRAGLVTPGLLWHDASRRTPFLKTLRIHPTDYLVVTDAEYRLIAKEFEVLRASTAYGPLLLVGRKGRAAPSR